MFHSVRGMLPGIICARDLACTCINCIIGVQICQKSNYVGMWVFKYLNLIIPQNIQTNQPGAGQPWAGCILPPVNSCDSDETAQSTQPAYLVETSSSDEHEDVTVAQASTGPVLQRPVDRQAVTVAQASIGPVLQRPVDRLRVTGGGLKFREGNVFCYM